MVVLCIGRVEKTCAKVPPMGISTMDVAIDACLASPSGETRRELATRLYRTGPLYHHGLVLGCDDYGGLVAIPMDRVRRAEEVPDPGPIAADRPGPGAGAV